MENQGINLVPVMFEKSSDIHEKIFLQQGPKLTI